jgi:Zn-ribbon protein, possibly nucleic acid-binding
VALAEYRRCPRARGSWQYGGDSGVAACHRSLVPACPCSPLIVKESTLNADPAHQLRLLDVQALDTDLDRIQHRRSNLDEQARVDDLSTQSRVIADRLTAIGVEVADLSLEQRKADNDVELVRERAAKDAALLDSGTITDSKQLTHLQSEIASLARRQAELEDVEIEIMERLEGAEHRLRDLTADKERLDAESDQAHQDLQRVLDELEATESQTRSERDALAAEIAPELLGLYERLRSEYSGVGAAKLFRGRCEGCRIELTPVDISRIREAAPDEVLRCEECRRILVRTDESGL